MSSRLSRITPAPRAANVIDLASARGRRSGGGSTVIVGASIVQAAATVYRQIGVNAALHLSDLHRILDICFGFDAVMPQPAPHWGFYRAGELLSGASPIAEILGQPGSTCTYQWGLWRVELLSAEAYRRDAQTPQALCVGGAGTLAELGPAGYEAADFDIAYLNAQLTGSRVIQEVLAATRPEVREVIHRSGLFNFVPLLQAMDLSGEVELPAETRRRLIPLPLESDSRGQDAFWSVLLGLSCLADEALADVAATTMTALGWPEQAITKLYSAAERSLSHLADVGCFGGWGATTLAPVDRLQVYRALLRAGGPGVG